MPAEAAMNRYELQQWLDDHEMTPQKLAETLRINRTSLYKWLRGAHPVPRSVVLALAHIGARHSLYGAEEPMDGEDLAAWMRDYAFDNRLLADAFGVHPMSVGRWLSDVHPITYVMRVALLHLSEDKAAFNARKHALEFAPVAKSDAKADARARAEKRIEAARAKAAAATLR